jgi:5-methylcytosine-specific restriction protein A
LSVCERAPAPARCARCERRWRRRQSQRYHNPFYDTLAWRRLATGAVRAHVEEFGWVCPGYRRPPHESTDLTADHIRPLAVHGSALDPTNIQVLCRSCNGAKGAHQRP